MTLLTGGATIQVTNEKVDADCRPDTLSNAATEGMDVGIRNGIFSSESMSKDHVDRFAGDVSNEAVCCPHWVTSDELDPQSLTCPIVRLDSSAFTHLWEGFATRQLEVVADIYTHPLGPA